MFSKRGLKGLKTVGLLLLTGVLLMVLTSCSSLDQSDRLSDSLQGRIILTLARGDADAQLMQYAPEGLPRSPYQVFDELEGYLIRLEGSGGDEQFVDCTFGLDEEERSVGIFLNPGESYTISLLAYGPLERPVILGGGRAEGITVPPGETETVQVDMYPYRFEVTPENYDGTSQEVPIDVYLYGPFLEDVLHSDLDFARLYISNYIRYDDYEMTENPDEETLIMGPVNRSVTEYNAVYDCYHFTFGVPEEHFTDAQNGLYLQAGLRVRPEWLAAKEALKFIAPFQDVDGSYSPVTIYY